MSSIKELLVQANQAEQDSAFETAAGIYKKIIAQDDVNEAAYNRLFIMLRKLKNYKEELKWIKAGIKAFEKRDMQGRSKSRKVAELSKMLSKATGLADKKGNVLVKTEPVAGWEKRMKVVVGRVK